MPQILLAAASGVSLSLVGIAMRVVSLRGVDTQVISLWMLACGAVVFCAWSAAVPAGDAAVPALLLGAAAGLTQYGVGWMCRLGLAMGPLTPLWSALLLSFAVPMAWSVLAHGAPLGAGAVFSLLCAAGCVFASSRVTAVESAAPPTGSARWWYLLVLLGALVLNGGIAVALVELGHRGWVAGDRHLMAAMYTVAGCATAIELVCRGVPASRCLGVWRWGLLAAGGSVAGMVLINVAIHGGAGPSFVIQSVASILGAVLAGAWWFRERTGLAWWSTVLLAVTAVAGTAVIGR